MNEERESQTTGRADDTLGELLPKTSERARPGFETAVFQRIAQRRRRRLAAAGVAASLAFALVTVWFNGAGSDRGRPADEHRAAEATRLEAEAAHIEAELRELRAIVNRPQRVYLGGSERVDLFIDMDQIVRARQLLEAAPAYDSSSSGRRVSPMPLSGTPGRAVLQPTLADR